MIRERMLIGLVGAALVVGACGGAAATTVPGETTGGGQTTATGSSGDATSSETTATETTSEASETTAQTTQGGATGSNAACELVSSADVEAVSILTGLATSAAAPGETDALSTCAWLSNNTTPAAIISILDPTNTNTDPAAYVSLPGSVDVSIPGVKAVWVPAAGNVLFVIKGDRVATVMVIAPKNDDAQGMSTELGKKVGERL